MIKDRQQFILIKAGMFAFLLFWFANKTGADTTRIGSFQKISDTFQKVLALQFDDRYQFPEEVTYIETTEVVSRQTGTDEMDVAVLSLNGEDSSTVKAVGCGEASVYLADGSVYTVRVTTAPIMLVLFAGQSNTEGRPAEADKIDQCKLEQVRCPEGTAYISYGPSDEYGQDMYKEVAWYEDEEQIGPLTVENVERFIPNSLYDNTQNDCYCKTNRLSDAPDAGGKGGSDAAFAYRWHELTGEKVWLINAAHHGSRISTWEPETDENDNYQEAVAMFREAERVLSQEIRAGHYTLIRKGIVWDQGENNYSTGSSRYFKAMKRMIEGFWKDLNGSGIEGVEMEPSFFGIMIVRSGNMDTEPADFLMTGPRLAQYYASYADGLQDTYLAMQVREEWTTDQAVKDYFVKKYGTEEKFREAYPTIGNDFKMPETVAEVRGFYHYSQLAYNEIGMDAAENLCYTLGYATPPEIRDIQFIIVTKDGMTDRTGTVIERTEEKLPLAFKVFPTWLTKELAVTVNGNAKYNNGHLRLKGEGKIEVIANVRGETAEVWVE